jgi:energy-coupling factor transport system substrate-specific component
LLVGVASLVGLSAFFYPFVMPFAVGSSASERTARSAEAPLLLGVVTTLALIAMMVECTDTLGAAGAAAKTIALLGALVAVDSALRLMPTWLGASPIFLLIILVGYTFGSTFGFLMGGLTLFVSAVLTGGIGPWLPYQMLGAGWIGLTAGWLPRLRHPRWRLIVIGAFGGVWGLAYGGLLNLYSWPFAAPGLQSDVGLYWTPGMSLGETLHRYGAFYLTTSLTHDLFRAMGNVVLILILGGPLLRVLERFRLRFGWRPLPFSEPATRVCLQYQQPDQG